MNTSKFENLIIPAEILFNKNLSDREKILLSAQQGQPFSCDFFRKLFFYCSKIA